jgi:hypothetical protein
MNYLATQGWFTYQGTRGRLSWLGANILQIMIFGILFMVLVGSSIVALFGTALTGNAGAVAGAGIGVYLTIAALLIGYLFISWAILVQRIRSCGVVETGHLILAVLASIIVPFSGIVWLFWPPKDVNYQAPTSQPKPKSVEPKVEVKDQSNPQAKQQVSAPVSALENLKEIVWLIAGMSVILAFSIVIVAGAKVIISAV